MTPSIDVMHILKTLPPELLVLVFVFWLIIKVLSNVLNVAVLSRFPSINKGGRVVEVDVCPLGGPTTVAEVHDIHETVSKTDDSGRRLVYVDRRRLEQMHTEQLEIMREHSQTMREISSSMAEVALVLKTKPCLADSPIREGPGAPRK